MSSRNKLLRKKRLFSAISTITASTALVGIDPVIAQGEGDIALEQIVVTASRREESIMDIPINVSALSGLQLDELRLDNLAEIARYIPGLDVVDIGARDSTPNPIVRGLNTDSIGSGLDGGLLAIYIGDIPVSVDLKPNDMERVEVLIGPQGTLYGAGTMAGAIRYLPNQADTSNLGIEVRGSAYSVSKSDGISTDVGFTLNYPIIPEVLAARVVIDQLDDEGFIDYNYVVREPGVSLPNPAPADRGANLRTVKDASGEETRSGKINLRWTPSSTVDINFWYFFQDTDAEGRRLNGDAAIGTGKYVSPYRVLEPKTYENELISFDVKTNLGFAEATFVYGQSSYDSKGQRDQTDLLMGIDSQYASFPAFTAFTREIEEDEIETLEFRLVSQNEGPFSWVAGIYHNELDGFESSEEYVPNYDQFAVDNLGGVQLRPDALEYYSVDNESEEETALYGEISYALNEQFEFTFGYRMYNFDVANSTGTVLPFYETVFEGAPQDFKDLNVKRNNVDDEGDVIKLNVSWTPNENMLSYFTYAQGYRNGGVNPIRSCTQDDINNPGQSVCALPDEVGYDPDTIDSYEVGMKATWLDGRLTTNAALYLMDWDKLQVSDATQNGEASIISNGKDAQSRGLEFSGRWLITEHWEAALTYAYVNAELTSDSPGLVSNLTAPSGARLPGSAEHQSSFNLIYHTYLFEAVDFAVNYGFTYTGDVMNIIGGEEEPTLASRFGENIDSYTLHHLAATFSTYNWSVQLFADNLTDEYYVTSTRGTRRRLAANSGTINGRARRDYGEYVGTPRTLGIKMSYSF